MTKKKKIILSIFIILVVLIIRQFNTIIVEVHNQSGNRINMTQLATGLFNIFPKFDVKIKSGKSETLKDFKFGRSWDIRFYFGRDNSKEYTVYVDDCKSGLFDFKFKYRLFITSNPKNCEVEQIVQEEGTSLLGKKLEEETVKLNPKIYKKKTSYSWKNFFGKTKYYKRIR